MVDAVNTHGEPVVGAVVCSPSDVASSVGSLLDTLDVGPLVSATSDVGSGVDGGTPGGGLGGGGLSGGGPGGGVVSPLSEVAPDGVGNVGVTGGGGDTGVTGGVTELEVEGLSLVVSPPVDGDVEHATHSASASGGTAPAVNGRPRR